MTASAYVTSVWRLALILNDCLTKVLRPVMRRYGITQSQAQLLFSVHRDSEATVGIIAEKLGLARTNVSAMCKKLAHMGFLKRKRCEDDERFVSVVLTETGRDAARIIEKRIEKVCREKKNINLQEVEKMLHTFSEISTLLTEED
ncbi:MAG: winged helix-turn-helix transcriptional regulator [Ruminococcaceae bacterium]|nr:winged helix-turn-helix transcriptional regulator [Oscillospiraceae bacterium]